MIRGFEQDDYRVRLDWGLQGAEAVAQTADVAVIVDVLSFTTTVSVAVEQGTAVLPYRWNGESARVFAQEQNAVLAVGRSCATAGQISLSPATLRATRPSTRLVLPSPNGSTIAHHLSSVSICLAACFRNAGAVTEWVAARDASRRASPPPVLQRRHGDGDPNQDPDPREIPQSPPPRDIE